MKTFLEILACTSFLLTLAGVCHAKEWRGITPMRSTRQDVERVLGGPPPPPKDGKPLDKGRSIYFLDVGEVSFVFAEPEVPTAAYCVGRIPAGTVLMIQITPKPDWVLSELQLDEKQLRKFNPAGNPDVPYEGYIDEKEGLVVRTFKGRVEQIIYLASSQDQKLCPAYYANPESFVDVFVCGLGFMRKFDEYGDIPFNDEKARLDNVAIELQQQAGTEVHIIAYAGRKARVGEAQVRADRAKNYLERRLKTLGRVTTTDGGYRDELTLEFFFITAGAAPPSATPTVEPSEVEFIYETEKPTRPRKP